MKTEQLDLFAVIQDKKIQEDIYYNGEGESLPWEAPEYVAKHYGNPSLLTRNM